MPRFIVFDVNETLLNVSALEPQFQTAFGDFKVLREWFSQLLQYSMAVTIVGQFFDFSTLAAAALEMTAAARGLSLSSAHKEQILKGMLLLPAYPDVTDGLKRLKDAGLRLATLTNSSQRAAEQQIEHAGLSAYFDQILSVDTVRRYKPSAEVYRMAAEMLGVSIGDIRLVAAHAWDVFGAMQAGAVGAFVARPGKAWYLLAPKPDIMGPDLRAVADEIVKIELRRV